MQRTAYKNQKQKMNILTGKHMDQANKMAWDYHKKTGVDFNELQGVAFLALCEAANSFKVENGNQLSTYVYHCIKNAILTFLGKSFANSPAEEIEIPATLTPARIVEFKDSLINLGHEAGIIAEIILNAPSELLEIGSEATPKKIRKAIREFLVDFGVSTKKGGKNKIDKIEAAFNELEELFN